MSTLLLLILFGAILGFATIVILPFAGLIGTIVGGDAEFSSKKRIILGIIIASIGQTYFYLCYTAFIISWTRSRIADDSFFNYIIWVFAFLSTLIPIFGGAIMMNGRYRETNDGYQYISSQAGFCLSPLNSWTKFGKQIRSN